MNTKLFGLFIALLVCLPSFAQQKPVEKVDSDGVYLMPDQMPEFPGGMQAMMKFLTTNIKYPVEAQKKGVSGRVIVQFVIMEDGTLDQAKVVRGVDPLLDEEALRVVKLMPKWKPGIDRGEAVKVRFTAPIMFNLSRPCTETYFSRTCSTYRTRSGKQVFARSMAELCCATGRTWI